MKPATIAYLLASMLYAARDTVAAPITSTDPPTSGIILSPANGAFLSPGQPFDFQYVSKADYGVTSFNYTVFLLTEVPDDFVASEAFAKGFYFGRFAEPNYPGNPSPPNPAPSQLVMPDFSKNPGGWGAGQTISDGKFYISVLEEYGTGDGSVGFRMSLAVNQIVYNGTRTETE